MGTLNAQSPGAWTFVGLPERGVTFVQNGPTSATIANQTNRTILSFTLIWRGLDSQGQPAATGRFQYVNPDEILQPILQPGQSHTEDFGLSRKDYFSARPGGGQIILDAVVFEDGTVIGPDAGLTAERMQGRIRARLDVMRLLAAGDLTTVDQLTTAANQNAAVVVNNLPADLTPKGHDEYRRMYGAWTREAVGIARARGIDGFRKHVADIESRYSGINYHHE
jgi:hypothetical protein